MSLPDSFSIIMDESQVTADNCTDTLYGNVTCLQQAVAE